MPAPTYPTRLLLAALALTALGCAQDPGSTGVRRLILAQVVRHPVMEPQDLYKLLHQAAMGSEHAVDDTAGVRLWMERELQTMGTGPADPLVDTIAPGGEVVRVHLRPWVAAGRSTDSLLAAFLHTAGLFSRDTARLSRYLAVADSLAGHGELPFGAVRWRDLVEGHRRSGFPAVHHSESYLLAYRPAYRVVAGPVVP